MISNLLGTDCTSVVTEQNCAYLNKINFGFVVLYIQQSLYQIQL